MDIKSGVKWKKAGIVITITIAILVISSIMAVWSDSYIAAEMKFELEKLFYANNDTVIIDEDEMTMTIYDIADIEAVAEFLPEFLYPYYIPDGYELEKMDATKYKRGHYNFAYTFAKEEEKFYISGGKMLQEGELYIDDEIIETLEIEDRTIYVTADPVFESCGMSIVFKDHMALVGVGKPEPFEGMKEVSASLDIYEK